MRIIYTDEAGTAAHEPVTVVAAIIVDGDSQYMPVRERIDAALQKVPEKYRRDGFIFHAKTVSGKKYREGWADEDRIGLLYQMMAIPRETRIPFSYGASKRNPEISKSRDLKGLRLEQYNHICAFGDCMSSADQYIRRYGKQDEIAMLVAEDIPEMRRHLQESLKAIRKGVTTATGVVTPQARMQPGVSRIAPMRLHVARIIDSVHFTAKGDAPFLQVADAIAFGLRRYFSQQRFGREYFKAIFGEDPPDEPPMSRSDHECGYIFMEPMKDGDHFSGD